MHTAIYSAVGMIKKILIITTEKCNQGNEKFFFRPYKKMAKSFNKNLNARTIKLSIFFQCENGHTIEDIDQLKINYAQDFIEPVLLLPVEGDNNKAMPSWTQDFLHINPNNFLCLPNLPESLLNGLRENLNLENKIEFGNIFSGAGNIIRGNCITGDYLIIGKLELPYNIDDIAKKCGVLKERIMIFEIEGLNANSKLFYHLDMFMCLLGDTGDGKQTILIADPEGKINIPEDNVVSDVKKELLIWGRKIGIQFKFIDIPTIFIRDTNGIHAETISYLNAIVENYHECDNHHLNIFLPSYSFEEKYEFEKQFKRIISSVDGVDRNRAFEKAVFFENDQLKKILLAEIPHLQLHFIDYNFRGMTHLLASLHCLTKVVERDLID